MAAAAFRGRKFLGGVSWGLLLLGACSEAPSDGPDGGLENEKEDEVQDEAKAAIGTDGGTVAIEGASVTIFAGALDERVEVEVTRLSASDAEALPAADLAGTTMARASAVFAFTPHGTQFSEPVEITFEVTERADVVLRLDDPTDATWEFVQDAVIEGGTAHLATDHFSLYAAFSIEENDSALDVCEQSCPEAGQILSCNGEVAACWKPTAALLPESFRFGNEHLTKSYGVDLDDSGAPDYSLWTSRQNTAEFNPTEFQMALIPLGADGSVGDPVVTDALSLQDGGGAAASLSVRGVYLAEGGYLIVGFAGFDRLVLLYVRSNGGAHTVHELIPDVGSPLPHGFANWGDIPLDHMDVVTAKAGGLVHVLWRLQDPDFRNDSRYDTYHRFSIPLTGYVPGAGTTYTAATTEVSNAMTLTSDSALNLSPLAVARGPAGSLAVFSHGTDGSSEQNYIQHLAVVDVEAGTLIAEERLDSLENSASGTTARQFSCSGAMTVGGTGPATTFLDLSRAATEAGGISGAAVLQSDLGAATQFAYLSTASGNAGALIRSSCTAEFESDATPHSILGASFGSGGDLSSFLAVSVAYGGDISSGNFVAFGTDDVADDQLVTSTHWSPQSAEVSVSTVIPASSGLRVVGTQYSASSGRRFLTLDLDADGKYAEPLPPL